MVVSGRTIQSIFVFSATERGDGRATHLANNGALFCLGPGRHELGGIFASGQIGKEADSCVILFPGSALDVLLMDATWFRQRTR
jgi:hypothetical protein